MIVQMKMEYPDLLQSITAPVYIRRQQHLLFEQQFIECFRLICEKIGSRKNMGESKLGRQVLNYINEHLCEKELYLMMVVDYFKISPPTIQKLIKNMTGQTFLVYVEKQRLTKAWKILTEGGVPIHEVSVKCGFSNTNSFYKAFKRTYGFPPSEIGTSSF